jgi:hypothetical protein
MVSEISEISSSAVTKGEQICSVLLWIVRISKPASVHASATASPETSGHNCTPAMNASPARTSTTRSWVRSGSIPASDPASGRSSDCSQ